MFFTQGFDDSAELACVRVYSCPFAVDFVTAQLSQPSDFACATCDGSLDGVVYSVFMRQQCYAFPAF